MDDGGCQTRMASSPYIDCKTVSPVSLHLGCISRRNHLQSLRLPAPSPGSGTVLRAISVAREPRLCLLRHWKKEEMKNEALCELSYQFVHCWHSANGPEIIRALTLYKRQRPQEQATSLSRYKGRVANATLFVKGGQTAYAIRMLPAPAVRVVVKLPYNRPENAPGDPPKVRTVLYPSSCRTNMSSKIEWTPDKADILWKVIEIQRARSVDSAGADCTCRSWRRIHLSYIPQGKALQPILKCPFHTYSTE